MMRDYASLNLYLAHGSVGYTPMLLGTPGPHLNCFPNAKETKCANGYDLTPFV